MKAETVYKALLEGTVGHVYEPGAPIRPCLRLLRAGTSRAWHPKIPLTITTEWFWALFISRESAIRLLGDALSEAQRKECERPAGRYGSINLAVPATAVKAILSNYQVVVAASDTAQAFDSYETFRNDPFSEEVPYAAAVIYAGSAWPAGTVVPAGMTVRF